MTGIRTQGERHDRVWRRGPHVAAVLIGTGSLPAGLLWCFAGSFWASAWLEAWIPVAFVFCIVALLLLGNLWMLERISDARDPAWRDRPIDDP
jgi:hypothetical protein